MSRPTGTVVFVAVVAAAALQWLIGSPLAAQSAQARSLPIFEVDSAWPQIPDKWKLGDPSSFAIDAQDNVWLLHRSRTLPPEQASMAAPPARIGRNSAMLPLVPTRPVVT